MTVPNERKAAVDRTRAFLYDLLSREKYPRLPREVRERASSLLKHYPCQFHMDIIANREDAYISNGLEPKVFGNSWK